MEENAKTWIDEMVERQALPQSAREGTTEEWCEKHGVARQTFYYQLSKEENQKRILEISLNRAKNELPEVLDALIQNSKRGKEKSIEMYLDYILKLAKNLDIKSDGKPLIQIAGEIATKYGITSSDTKSDSKG